MDSTKKFLTPAQAAKLLHVSPVTIRYWASEGKLNFITTAGGHRRFKLSDIESLQNLSTKTNTQPAILVVEDNELHAELVVDFLSDLSLNYRIIIAKNGFEAGSFIHSETPKLIILDIMMPGLDGFAVCEQIRANNNTKHIPIIAMSGHSDPETIVKITKSGADAFLNKPLNITIFNKTVQKFLK